MASLTKPSSAGIWAPPGGCRAYGLLSSKYSAPYKPHPRTLEGLAAHELAEMLIDASAHGDLSKTPGREIIGTVWGKNKQVMTAEMLEAAEIYAMHASCLMLDLPCFKPEVEKRVKCHGGNGYIDLKLSNQDILWIVDFKFGNGPVKAFENYQLLDYAIAECRDRQYTTINLAICQPPVNGYDLDVWTLSLFELMEYKEVMDQSAKEANEPNPTARTGSHCKYCDARWACVAFKDSTDWSMEFCSKALTNEPSIEQVIDNYEMLQLAERQLKFALDAAKQRMINKLQAGESVPGYSFQNKPGNLAWTDRETALIEGVMNGIEVVKPWDLITPTQAKKLGMDIKDLSERKSGSLKLEKINPKEMFKDVKFN